MSGLVDAIFGGSNAPDNSGINAAAVANAELSKESLDWYKQIYTEQAPARAEAAKRANQVSDAQLYSMGQNSALSKDYADYQANTYRPLEEGIVANAQTYDTAERRSDMQSQAVAGVGQQFDLAQQSQQRNMARMGVNPSSGKQAALSTQTAIAGATAKAGAALTARNQVETQGYARKMDAANLGRGLASNQATSASVAMNAGNSAVNNAGIPLVQANQATQIMGQGFGTAINANNSAGSLYGQAAQIQNASNANDNAMWVAAGNAAGAFAASDVTKKKNIKPVSDKQALAAIEKTPVSTWKYKAGEGDGGSHTGPMAQQVEKNMGSQAAPGGKMIDLVTLNGQNMAAIAALSRKVDKLAKAKKGVAA